MAGIFQRNIFQTNLFQVYPGEEETGGGGHGTGTSSAVSHGRSHSVAYARRLKESEKRLRERLTRKGRVEPLKAKQPTKAKPPEPKKVEAPKEQLPDRIDVAVAQLAQTIAERQRIAQAQFEAEQAREIERLQYQAALAADDEEAALVLLLAS